MGIMKKFAMKFSKIERNLYVKITKMYVFNFFLGNPSKDAKLVHF